jgi:hypothetical protein
MKKSTAWFCSIIPAVSGMFLGQILAYQNKLEGFQSIVIKALFVIAFVSIDILSTLKEKS